MEKETISMEWKDSGDISNADLLPKVGLLEPDYHCTSRSMFGDITTGMIQKELRYGESSNYWKRVRGGNGTLPKKISRKDHKVVASILKDSLSDPRRLKECIFELESRGYSRAADTVERFQFDLMNYLSFSAEHWRRIRTTNLLERVNKELKLRSRSIGAFPNDQSLLRIAGSILMDINEEWITSRRYLSDLGEISTADAGAEITAY